MKKLFFILAILSLPFISIAQVIGGSGVCITSGNPNGTSALNTQDMLASCVIAFDTSTKILYYYDATYTIGTRWRQVNPSERVSVYFESTGNDLGSDSTNLYKSLGSFITLYARLESGASSNLLINFATPSTADLGKYFVITADDEDGTYGVQLGGAVRVNNVDISTYNMLDKESVILNCQETDGGLRWVAVGISQSRVQKIISDSLSNVPKENIYTSDGTVASNRVVTLNQNSLIFSMAGFTPATDTFNLKLSDFTGATITTTGSTGNPEFNITSISPTKAPSFSFLRSMNADDDKDLTEFDAVTINTALGRILFGGYYNGSSALYTSSVIYSEATSNWSSTANSYSKLIFNTFGSGDSGSNAPKLEIGDNGQIRFHKYGSGSFTGTVTKTLGVTSNGSIVEYDASAGGVTSISTGNGLTGGPITTTGTISADTAVLGSKVWANNALALKLNIADTTTMLAPYLLGFGTSGRIPRYTGTRTFAAGTLGDDGTRVTMDDGNTATAKPFRLDSWTTAARPATPSVGDAGNNTTTGNLDFYTGTAWESFAKVATQTGLGTQHQIPVIDVNGRISYNANLRFNLTDNNFSIGSSASVTTSINNFFVGQSAGQNNTGANNTFIGRLAGLNNTGGANNFFGFTAGEQNTSGTNNNFYGQESGRNSRTGSHNNFFGSSAGFENRSGSGNNFFGQNAGYNTIIADTLTGSNNTAIGTAAARNIAGAAFGNLVLGNSVNLPTGNGSNQVVIKNLIFGTGASGTGTTIVSGSRVGIKNNAPERGLHVNAVIRSDSLSTFSSTTSQLVGATAGGDLAGITIGSGLTLTSGTLTSGNMDDGNTATAKPLRLDSWTTAARPGTPSVGDVGNNTTNNNLDYYTGTAWENPLKSGTPNGLGTTSRVFYADANGRAVANDDLVWDATNNRLAINATSASTNLHVNGNILTDRSGFTGNGVLDAVSYYANAINDWTDVKYINAAQHYGEYKGSYGANSFGFYQYFVKSRTTNGSTLASVQANDEVYYGAYMADNGTSDPSLVAAEYVKIGQVLSGGYITGIYEKYVKDTVTATGSGNFFTFRLSPNRRAFIGPYTGTATNTLDVDGTFRVRTLTGSTPTRLVGADANGVLGDVSAMTSGIKIPTGTTAQRSVAPVAGETRFNTTNSTPEFYNGTSWVVPAQSASATGLFTGNRVLIGTTTGINQADSLHWDNGLTLFGTSSGSATLFVNKKNSGSNDDRIIIARNNQATGTFRQIWLGVGSGGGLSNGHGAIGVTNSTGTHTTMFDFASTSQIYTPASILFTVNARGLQGIGVAPLVAGTYDLVRWNNNELTVGPSYSLSNARLTLRSDSDSLNHTNSYVRVVMGPTEVARWTAGSRRLGLRTSTPQQALHVVGKIQVDTLTDTPARLAAFTGTTGSGVLTRAVLGSGLTFSGDTLNASTTVADGSITQAKLANGAAGGAKRGRITYVPVDSVNYDATSLLAAESEIVIYLYLHPGTTGDKYITLPAPSSTYEGKKVTVFCDNQTDPGDLILAGIYCPSEGLRYKTFADVTSEDYYEFSKGETSNYVIIYCLPMPWDLAVYKWVVMDGFRGGF